MTTFGNTGRLILGNVALSGYLNEAGIDRTVDVGDVTVLTSTGHEVIPGLGSAKVPLAGFLDDTPHGVMTADLAVTAGEVVSYATSGFAVGNATVHCLTHTTSAMAPSKPDAPNEWKLDLTSSGTIDHGVSLADLAAQTTTGNGTSQDNTASSADGGAAFLHVTAYSGFTNVAFKIQHSTDGTTWSDLASFTSVTATTSQRVEVSGTVNRYLRVIRTVSGTGSVTYQASFARR